MVMEATLSSDDRIQQMVLAIKNFPKSLDYEDAKITTLVH